MIVINDYYRRDRHKVHMWEWRISQELKIIVNGSNGLKISKAFNIWGKIYLEHRL